MGEVAVPFLCLFTKQFRQERIVTRLRSLVYCHKIKKDVAVSKKKNVKAFVSSTAELEVMI